MVTVEAAEEFSHRMKVPAEICRLETAGES